MIQYYSAIETDKSENVQLEAFRAQQIYMILIGLAANRQTTTYKILSRKLGYKGSGTMQHMLGRIAYWCLENDLPALTALVVNQETGLPGIGIPCEEDLDAERENVFTYDWFDIVVPSPDELPRNQNWYSK